VLDLRADEVHVWLVPAASAASVAHVIDHTERDRANRFVLASSGELFVAAHGAARLILGGYLDADPASLAFATTPDGKPYLECDRDIDLAFNLAHSGGLALLGVATRRPVGVDVEARRVLARRDALARRIMTPHELAHDESLDDESRSRHLLDVWARKEAVLKAQGTGLRVELSSFPSELSEDDPWWVVDLDVSGYAAAVASTGRCCRPVLRSFAAHLGEAGGKLDGTV
jgi:4'-phosphopantetheinyl transferase